MGKIRWTVSLVSLGAYESWWVLGVAVMDEVIVPVVSTVSTSIVLVIIQ
jgi:hypothetical protein